MGSPFNLNDMIAASNNTSEEFDASAIFRQNPVSGKVAADPHSEPKEEELEEVVETDSPNNKKVEEAPWVPDADVLAETPDVGKSSGVVYNKEDVKLHADTELKNISDEIVTKESAKEQDEMTRIGSYLRQACFRNGIRELHIPDMCPERLTLINIAGIKDPNQAAEKLDLMFKDLKVKHPDWMILVEETTETTETDGSETIINPGKPGEDGIKDIKKNFTIEDVKIIIDKSQMDQLEFTEDELAKIRKSRTIELNIKEKGTINFSSIAKAPEDSIDKILNAYKPHVNGLQIVLPASRYRCTVTGLSYPDIIELGSDRVLNDQDSLRSIWSVCFNHIHNPSIGAWESYTVYTDPTGEVHKVPFESEVPEDAINKHDVTEYEDFMNKTSYIDQEFIIWNILCLTASNQELVTTKCLNKRCERRIEFSYNPNELLMKDSISEIVSHEMETTRTVSTEQEIKDWYEEGLIYSTSVAELPDSKIKIRYGHVSANTYVEELYGNIVAINQMLHQIENDEDNLLKNRGLIGKLQMKMCQPSIISFILQDPDNPERLLQVENREGISKILDSLSVRDSAVVAEISSLVTTPYRFRYRINGKRCPHCGTLNNFNLGGVDQLLFLIDGLTTGMKISLVS